MSPEKLLADREKRLARDRKLYEESPRKEWEPAGAAELRKKNFKRDVLAVLEEASTCGAHPQWTLERIAEETQLVITACKVTKELYGYTSLLVDERATLKAARNLYNERTRKPGVGLGLGRYPNKLETEAMEGVIAERAEAYDNDSRF